MILPWSLLVATFAVVGLTQSQRQHHIDFIGILTSRNGFGEFAGVPIGNRQFGVPSNTRDTVDSQNTDFNFPNVNVNDGGPYGVNRDGVLLQAIPNPRQPGIATGGVQPESWNLPPQEPAENDQPQAHPPIQQPVGVSSFESASTNENSPHNPKSDVELVTAGTNRFAGDVYKGVAQGGQGNLAICPFSVAIVLAILQGGAEDNTLKQINDVVGLPPNKQQTKTAFATILPNMLNNERYDVNIANNIYHTDKISIKPQFDQSARSYFSAGFEPLNFDVPNQAAEVVNRWVRQQTRNKIQQIVNPSELGRQTRLLLINALYFKAKWQVPFDKYETLRMKFFSPGGVTDTVEMMKVTDRFKYSDDAELRARFVEMPYEGGAATMTFVLPYEKDGLPALENNIQGVLNKPLYKEEIVRALVPKFSIENKIPFKQVLQTLGITDLFTRNVRLGGLTDSKYPLTVDNILQKTFFNVTEKGTEAAAVTAVQVVPLSAGSPRNPNAKEFRADHPFIYILRDRTTNVVLFIGRFSKPTK